MRSELEYILKKYSMNPDQKCPIDIKVSRLGGLTGLFNELGYKTGAEIGIDCGKFSERICQDVPNTKLYCIDPWLAHPDYSRSATQSAMDSAYTETINRLSKYINYEIIRKTSMDAVKDFTRDSLDFVYIDGNHSFKYVINDIIEWSEIVRQGGIVSGHDYVRYTKRPVHVVTAVHAYIEVYNIRPWFVLGRGDIDETGSWFWVKS